MKRREFITLLGGAAAWPLAARAQQSVMPVVGLLSSRSQLESAQHVLAFQQGLNALGYVDGRNVAIEYRWADGQYERLQTFAAELAARPATVIVATGGNISATAGKAATATVQAVRFWLPSVVLRLTVMPQSGYGRTGCSGDENRVC